MCRTLLMAGRRRCFARRGFSLIELMVVVLIIAISAALAIPSMADARYDQHAYQDAGSIMQLFREARTRAIARGGAVTVSMTANGPGDRGTFQVYEAVSTNAGGVGLARTPVASCKTPTVWNPLNATNLNVLFINGVNLNGLPIETQANVTTSLLIYTDPTTNTGTTFFQGYVCYTPLGHSYVSVGAGSTPAFDGLLPTISPLVVRLSRGGAANVRDVLIPPNGMARLVSHTGIPAPVPLASAPYPRPFPPQEREKGCRTSLLRLRRAPSPSSGGGKAGLGGKLPTATRRSKCSWP